MIINEDIYIEHFGVKGMRWGVRNERKPVTESSLRFKTKVSGLDPITQVRLGMIGAALLTKGATNIVQSGQVHSMAAKGKAFITGKPVWDKNSKLSNPKMSEDEIMSSVVKDINPNYARGYLGAKGNCRRCTFAYEMRRRGYDVKATETSIARGQDIGGVYNAITPGKRNFVNPGAGVLVRLGTEKVKKTLRVSKQTPFNDFRKKFSVSGLQRIKDPELMFNNLAKQPNRARGEISMQWKIGGGHSMAWEIVNNKPVIFDAQSGKKFKSYEEFNNTFKASVKEMGITRLDNVALNDNFLLRWLK